MPISKLLTLPYGSYLMVRLDYRIICGNELEAKILRIIEMYMDDERRQIYRDLLNDPQNTIDPNAEVEVTKDVWPAISHRLFKNDLYDQDMSENTLKRAIKSLVDKKYIRVRDERTKRYEAPKYQINAERVQTELNILGKLGKTEYQKLMVSKIDGIKNASYQKMTPAGYQKLTVSPDLMVSKIDPNSRKITDSVEEREEDTYTERESQSHDTGAIAPTHTQVSPSEKTQQVATVRAHEPAPQAQLSTVAMSSPQACAKVEKRASGKKVVEPPAFTAEGQKVYDAWCSLFKSPPRAAEKTADCANDLYARLVPWCRELNISCKQLLSDIKGWCYATDPDWYRKKGVTLCDIGSQFERWQSAKTEEMEQAKKPSILPKTPTGTVSGLKRWVAPAHMQQGG